MRIGARSWLAKAIQEIDLKSTESVLPLDQDRKDLETVRHVVASFDDFSLAGLHMVTSACGSVALGLATADGEINGDRAWELSLLEETYQINEWGEDPEATNAGQTFGRISVLRRGFCRCCANRMKSVHVSIEGRVQGVWYRAWTTEQAKKRGLDGGCATARMGRRRSCFRVRTRKSMLCSLPADRGARPR